MPRYYFDRRNGMVELEDEGIDLPDLDAARRQAIIYAGETLKDEPEAVCQAQDLQVEVTDSNLLILFTIVISAEDTASSFVT